MKGQGKAVWWALLLVASVAGAEPVAEQSSASLPKAEAKVEQAKELEAIALPEKVLATDGEVRNRGVDFYRAGDWTNALKTLRPLVLSKTHGARAAEVVAKLAHLRAQTPDLPEAEVEDLLTEASEMAQLALRAHPQDARVGRNFTRAIDGLPALRARRRLAAVLKASAGKGPDGILRAARDTARSVFAEAATYQTNTAAQAVAAADRLETQVRRLADDWLCVREGLAQSVTNAEQAATLGLQLDQARERTLKAARLLGDLSGEAYGEMSGVETDFTRFYKGVVLPPQALAESELCQSNACVHAEGLNGRSWQLEALDYTRAFRMKFPAWARAYEQQTQGDTNAVPFTAAAQAKIAGLATELEKVQLSCVSESAPSAEAATKALRLIGEIQELMPKDKQNSSTPPPQSNPNQNPNQNPNPKQDPKQNQDSRQNSSQSPAPAAPQPDQPEAKDEPQAEAKDEPQAEAEDEAQAEAEAKAEQAEQEIEALLRKAKERNDEHEELKRVMRRKAPLSPNERDW